MNSDASEQAEDWVAYSGYLSRLEALELDDDTDLLSQIIEHADQLVASALLAWQIDRAALQLANPRAFLDWVRGRRTAVYRFEFPSRRVGLPKVRLTLLM